MISWEEFDKIDLRAGTIVKSEPFEGVRKPALKLWIDFGPNCGIKESSTQITQQQITNFSEVLVTGFPDKKGVVVLSTIDKAAPNGSKLF